MLKSFDRLILSIGLIIVLSFIAGCHNNPPNNNTAGGNQNGGNASATGAAYGPGNGLSEDLDKFISSDDAREALSKIFAENKFRLARKDDFKIPDWAWKSESKVDIDNSINRPYMAGDINGDNQLPDYAFIIVDTKKTDSNRFSLIVFNRPTNFSDDYKAEWIMKDQDLSAAILSWDREKLQLTRYGSKTADRCALIWDKEKSAYSCVAGEANKTTAKEKN